jgi:GDP-mannose 6-dehydrogenase
MTSKRISVFGLGYVGTVTAACLAANGHEVIGVDVATDKVESVNRGRSPIVEHDVDRIIGEAVAAGKLRATTETDVAIFSSDLALICVGTPSSANGSVDTQYVERVAVQIGDALGRSDKRDFLFVLRSTVTPGTTRKLVIPALERATASTTGLAYNVVFHPEFLREGSSVEDFYHPPKIIMGESRSGASERLLELYEGIEAPRFVTSLEVAEMTKYADNAFHAVKITFANEIGRLSKSLGLDSRDVMKIFCSDTQLNISPAYLRPGFAFGGSCLPKDVRALLYEASQDELELPLLAGLLPSNSAQVENALKWIEGRSPELIGLAGLSFKPNTDDLRESPLVTLADRLIGRGYGLRIYDPSVETARLVGGNRAYVERHLPHLSKLLVRSLDHFNQCDLIVIGHRVQEQGRVSTWLEAGKCVLDLDGNETHSGHPGYNGLYW